MTEILDDIRQLYYRATAQTIERDFDRAIDLLKALPTEEARERAAVFMEGLAEMKKQWARPSGSGGGAAKAHETKAKGKGPRR